MIEAEDLRKTFGDVVAVDAVSLSAEDGRITGILGPNGAGKTTTIRMMMGILEPSGGRARIGGFDCFAQRHEVMRLVGYLPDEPVFYDYLRGGELLRFVGEMHGVASEELDARIAHWTGRLGLEDATLEFAANYSKGMRKKLALAAALLHEPELLILDEPTNGLDPYATRTVHEVLREQREAGTAVLFSTHLLDQAEKLCDRIAIIARGRIMACGELDTLRSELASGGSLEEVFFAATEDESA